MIGTERQNEILEYLKQHETISVRKIVENFFVSEATARRDLTALEKSGTVKRVFGGATLLVGADSQVPLFVREREDGEEKADLCERAAVFIREGSVIFIDGSSTARRLVPFLKKFKELIVVTNGLKLAEELSETEVKVFLTGGALIKNSYSLAGRDAEKFAEGFNADICFISCKGLSDDGLLTDTSYEETQLRKVFIKNSAFKVALITAGKRGKKYVHTLCSVEELDRVITTPTPLKVSL